MIPMNPTPSIALENRMLRRFSLLIGLLPHKLFAMSELALSSSTEEGSYSKAGVIGKFARIRN